MKSKFDTDGSVIIRVERSDPSYMEVAKRLARQRMGLTKIQEAVQIPLDTPRGKASASVHTNPKPHEISGQFKEPFDPFESGELYHAKGLLDTDTGRIHVWHPYGRDLIHNHEDVANGLKLKPNKWVGLYYKKDPESEHGLSAQAEMSYSDDVGVHRKARRQLDKLPYYVAPDDYWEKPVTEAIQPLREAGFTGIITAKNGVEYHYVNGKRVASHHQDFHLSHGGAQVVHPEDLDEKQVDTFAAQIKHMGHGMAAVLHAGPMTMAEIIDKMEGGKKKSVYTGKYGNAMKKMVDAGLIVKENGKYKLPPKGGNTPPPAPTTPQKPPQAQTPTPAPANASTGQPGAKNPNKPGTIGHQLYGILSGKGGTALKFKEIVAATGFSGQHDGKYYNALAAMVKSGQVEKTPDGKYKLKGSGTQAPPTPAPTKPPAAASTVKQDWDIYKKAAQILDNEGLSPHDVTEATNILKAKMNLTSTDIDQILDELQNNVQPFDVDDVLPFTGTDANGHQWVNGVQVKKFPDVLAGIHIKELGYLGGSAGVKKVEIGGKEYAMKKADAGQLAAEEAADQIYSLMGVAVPPAQYYVNGNQTTKLAEFVEGDLLNSLDESATTEAFTKLRKSFVLDALLANYDVVGTGHDNIKVDKDGNPYRIDNGSSFDYRAQGKKKAFTDDPLDDLKNMKNPSVNPWASQVFQGITDDEIKQQVAAIAAKKTEIIASTPKALQKTMENRINALVKAYPPKVKAAAAPPPPPKIDPTKFPPVPDFISSKQDQVDANKKACNDMLVMAAKGDLDGVKNYPLIDAQKNGKTGAFQQELANNLYNQQNPPPPPKPFRGKIDEIPWVFKDVKEAEKTLSYKAHDSTSAPELTPHQIGHYIVSEHVGVPDFDPPEIWHAVGYKVEKGFHDEHAAAYDTFSKKAKDRFKSMKGSSGTKIHGPFWAGKLEASDIAVSKELQAKAPKLPVGTKLWRKITLNDAQVNALAGSVGKVLQEPAMSETSIRKDWGWHGNVHFEMVTSEGATGLFVDNDKAVAHGSSNSYEKSLVLPPGARYLIQSAEKKAGHLHVKVIVLPTVDGQFPH